LTLKDKIDLKLSSVDGLPGVTSKLDIGNTSIYVHVAWMNGKIVHIDITLSRGGNTPFDSLPKTEIQAALEDENYAMARAWVEHACRMASSLLAIGEDIGSILSGWRGVKGYPRGLCPQLVDIPDVESIVPGPLHAVAVLIENRLPDWEEQFTDEVI